MFKYKLLYVLLVIIRYCTYQPNYLYIDLKKERFTKLRHTEMHHPSWLPPYETDPPITRGNISREFLVAICHISGKLLDSEDYCSFLVKPSTLCEHFQLKYLSILVGCQGDQLVSLGTLHVCIFGS